jgi:gamma-glutamyltranspeptidase/glutathione hydrolase
MPVKVSIGCRGIAADHPLAVKVGLDILEDGGNVFDAAISVSAVLSIAQPQMGEPGGDGFILGFIDDETIAYASSGETPSR